ncbi:MAG: S24 family peptidase [Bacteroidales bacterium]
MNEITEISDRIKNIIDYKHVTINAFARILGYNRSQVIYDILNKKSKPGFDFFNKLLTSDISENISINWLITGEGNMLVTKSEQNEGLNDNFLNENAHPKCTPKMHTQNNNLHTQNAHPDKKIDFSDPKFNMDFSEDEADSIPRVQEYRRASNLVAGEYHALETDASHGIPLIPTIAFAGPGAVAFEDIQIEEYYVIPELQHAEFMLRITGNSMYPKYSSGDVIACIKVLDIKYFQWNKVYAIYTKSQGIMVKRVHESINKDTIKLVSENPDYKPFEIPREDIVAVARVIGSVVLE